MSAKVRGPRALGLPKAQQSGRSRLAQLAICANQTRPRSPSPPSERLKGRCTLKRRSAASPERRSAPSRGAPLRAAGASPPSVRRAHAPPRRRPDTRAAPTRRRARGPCRRVRTPSSASERRQCASSVVDAPTTVVTSVARAVRRVSPLCRARAASTAALNALAPRQSRLLALSALQQFRATSQRRAGRKSNDLDAPRPASLAAGAFGGAGGPFSAAPPRANFRSITWRIHSPSAPSSISDSFARDASANPEGWDDASRNLVSFRRRRNLTPAGDASYRMTRYQPTAFAKGRDPDISRVSGRSLAPSAAYGRAAARRKVPRGGTANRRTRLGE